LEDKIKVYICSFKELSTFDYVDKESMGHPCVTTRKAENIYTGFKHLPIGSWNGILPANQIKVLDIIDEFCKENGLEYEIVDVASLGTVSKMRLMLKGIKAPTIIFKEKRIEGLPTKEDLKALISK